LKENKNGVYRLYEIIVGFEHESGATAVHILIKNIEATKKTRYKKFIENSEVICFTYSHMLL
jgi:hypothetical protein